MSCFEDAFIIYAHPLLISNMFRSAYPNPSFWHQPRVISTHFLLACVPLRYVHVYTLFTTSGVVHVCLSICTTLFHMLNCNLREQVWTCISWFEDALIFYVHPNWYPICSVTMCTTLSRPHVHAFIYLVVVHVFHIGWLLCTIPLDLYLHMFFNHTHIYLRVLPLNKSLFVQTT